MKSIRRHSRFAAGFSLIEFMIVILVLSIMMGAVFQQISLVQKRSGTEQNKLDMFQEAREFMDQMQRDLHAAGYPNQHNFGYSSSTPTNLYLTGTNDMHNAVGLVKIASGELWFEGDTDGTGIVQSVRYYLDNTGNNCPCLKRAQVAKQNGDPLTGQGTAVFQTEVQNVQNMNASGTIITPVFTAFDISGNSITLPIDFDANAETIASVRTIRMRVIVQAKNPDLQTGLAPIATLNSMVSLNNCSAASQSETFSCQ